MNQMGYLIQKPSFLKNKLTLFMASLFGATLVMTAAVPHIVSASGSAGVRWQSEVGSYGVKVLNYHSGYAGPRYGNTWHTNIVVYKKTSGGQSTRMNLHHSKVGNCYYGWDSMRNSQIYHICVKWSWLLWGAAIVAAGVIAWYIAGLIGLTILTVPVWLLA